MPNYEKINKQEEKSDKLEAVLEAPSTAEDNWEDIKNKSEAQGEAMISQAENEIDQNFDSFSSALASETGPVADLETIRAEAAAEIAAQKKNFNEEINSLDEKQESPANSPEKSLAAVKDAYLETKNLEKAIKKCSDPTQKLELQNQLAEKKSQLENSEASYKSLLSDKVKEGFQNDPEMSKSKALKEIIIPGLSALEQQKFNALPPDEQSFLQKGMQFAGKYLPKSKLARTLTVAGVVAVASMALSPAAGGSVVLYLGAKIGRSLAGSFVGEKVSEVVEKQIDKRSEKRQAENLEKINFSKEDINNSVDKLMELGDATLKGEKTREKLKNFVKIGTHIAFAGATMAGLELAEVGIEALHSGAEGAAKSAAEGAAEYSAKTLAAEAFLVSCKHAGIDLAGEKAVEGITEAAEETAEGAVETAI